MSQKVHVDTKPAAKSKIVWTQGVSLVASFLAVKGINLDPDTQVSVVLAIQGIQGVATWIMKTWFTNTVTPSSV